MFRTQESVREGSTAISSYRDQYFKGSRVDQEKALLTSTTLYVGNLSYFTTEEQIHELFGKCGDIKRIIMGLDKVKKTPCGFCFLEYYARSDGQNAMRYVNGTRLDDRIIRCDWDAGFKEGRQYGRGKSGGQIWDIDRFYLSQSRRMRTNGLSWRAGQNTPMEAGYTSVRDEYRTDYDEGRGGYGKIVSSKINRSRE